MKKAVLMDFGITTRLIIETDDKNPDQFDDEYIEKGWEKVLKSIKNLNAFDVFIGAEDDVEMPYDEESDDNDINIIYNDN